MTKLIQTSSGRSRIIEPLTLAVLVLLLMLVMASVVQAAPADIIASSTALPGGPSVEKTKSFWERTLDDPLAVFTVVLDALTASMAVLAWRQIRILRGEDETARMSAQAATKAANAAARQAEALISVELPNFMITATTAKLKEGGILVSLEVRNFGRSAAIITGWCLDGQVTPTLPGIPIYAEARKHPILRDEIVEPTRHFTLVQALDIPGPDLLLIGQGQPILIYGYLDYLDFMKHERREGFCVAFFSGSGPGRGGKPFWGRTGHQGYTYNREKTAEDRRSELAEGVPRSTVVS